MTNRDEYSDPTAPWSPNDDAAPPYQPPSFQPEQYPPQQYQPERYQPEQDQPPAPGDQTQPPYPAELAQEGQPSHRAPQAGFDDGSSAPDWSPAESPGPPSFAPAPPARTPAWAPRPKRRHAGCLIAAITPFLIAGVIAVVVLVLLRHEIKKLPTLPSGHCPSGDVIDCTAGDPYPTIGPSEFAADPQKPVFTGDVELRLLAHDLSADCASAATGALVAALNQHGCTQVARSTYVDPTGTIVASALVFNLPDKQDAEAVSTVADRDAPVRPIAGPSGPARGLPDRSKPELYYKSAVTGHYTLVLLVQRVDGAQSPVESAPSATTSSAPVTTASGGPTAATPAPSASATNAVPADIEKVMKSLGDAMADPIVARVWGGHG